MLSTPTWLTLLALLVVPSFGCSDGRDGDRDARQGGSDEPASDLISSLDEQTPELRFVLREWHGDLDGIISERFGLIRLLTVFEPMHYAVDGPKQGGITFETAREFEDFLNERLGIERPEDRIHVVLIPVRRDELIPFIRDGRGDIAAANLTITDERLREVDFSEPIVSDAYEIVVTAPDAEPIEALEDLSGRSVYVRRSSSYRESLEKVNRELEERGLPGTEIVEVHELLDDGAILELVHDGDIPATVVDAHIAEFWLQLYPNLSLHDSVRPRENSLIAFAVQKETPELVGHINAFVKAHGKGTYLGNVLIRRYFESPEWVERVSGYEVARRLDGLIETFRTYAALYDLDWRRLAAQAYQESGLDQGRRSSRGAIGLMQLMPATAREMGFRRRHHRGRPTSRRARSTCATSSTPTSARSRRTPELDPAAAQGAGLRSSPWQSYNAGPDPHLAHSGTHGRQPGTRLQISGSGKSSRSSPAPWEPSPSTTSHNVIEYSIRLQLQQRMRDERQALEADSGPL